MAMDGECKGDAVKSVMRPWRRHRLVHEALATLNEKYRVGVGGLTWRCLEASLARRLCLRNGLTVDQLGQITHDEVLLAGQHEP